jgi:integrase
VTEIYEKALALREMLARHAGEVLYEDHEGRPYYATDEYLSHISEEAEEILDTHGGEAPPRKQWTDAALVKVLSGSYTTRYTAILHDLVRLALLTGARLDELCALKVTDVHKEEDGWWIDIKQGKTAAAVRRVPVHESAAHVLKRRTAASQEGFLFDEEQLVDDLSPDEKLGVIGVPQATGSTEGAEEPPGPLGLDEA